LGFIRDVVIARLFGVYLNAQAFVIAFRIPNLFRDIVGEGASNAAIIPVLSEYNLKRSKEEFWELANILLNMLLVILSVITILGIIFSPLIVRMIALVLLLFRRNWKQLFGSSDYFSLYIAYWFSCLCHGRVEFA